MNITDILKIKHPIIQAPMAGGATTPELVAAVSNAGGLGSIGAGYLTSEDLQQHIKKTKSLTNKPFQVNLFIPRAHASTLQLQQEMCDELNKIAKELNIKLAPQQPPYVMDLEKQLEIVIAEKVPVVSSTFGVFTKEQISALDATLIGMATHLAEAKLIEDSGYDAVVAQGYEAGGHRGTFIGDIDAALIGNFALIPNLVDNLNIPVIAAGGIMDARGIKAALALGASAVQMGTVFLTCEEAGTHDVYKKRLTEVEYDTTILTAQFSGSPARGIRNTFIESTKHLKPLPFPIQNKLTKALRAEAAKENNSEFMSLWAGQGAYLCKPQTVQALFDSLLI